MCRSAPLVARKCKFAMKLVKNCIKQWQYCMDYQSILSDVDKHQRTCSSNPHKDMTLNIDDNFDENKFLNNFSTNNNENDKSQIIEADEELKGANSLIRLNNNHSVAEKSLRDKKLENVDFNKLSLDEEFEIEERKQNINVPSKSIKEESDYPKKLKVKSNDIDNLMILPHLHKHDLCKKKVYDKPSTWIWAGYFTELGCLNSFSCLFKQIDFEFPHFQCSQWEFQICCDCAKYYSENLETVRFQHRTYYPVFHKHPVNLELGSERKSWVCSGMGLPNKCLSAVNNEPLIGSKRWKWHQCNVQLWYNWLKRKDIEETLNNILVHEHQLFKGKFDKFFNRNHTILWDAGERSVGISHDIDNEQKILRCAPCDFNWCEEWFKLISENQKEEERASQEVSMLNQSITNLTPDQVVYLTNHAHPLFQVIDSTALWERVVSGDCISLDHKSNFSEPMYFKWVKQDKWGFVLWALCTSQYVKKVKSFKKAGTCTIF